MNGQLLRGIDYAIKVIPRLMKNYLLVIPNWILLKKSLKSHGVLKLKPFNIGLWHHGFFYFTGELNKKAVFLKIDKKLHFLQNEYVAHEFLREKVKLIPLVKFIINKSSQIAIFDFIAGESITERDIANNAWVSEEIYRILMVLNTNGVFHRDIKLENFIKRGETLYLIDFTFSVGSDSCPVSFKELKTGVEVERKILKHLGEENKPSELVWNDFHSMSLLVDRALLSSSKGKGAKQWNIFKTHLSDRNMTYSLTKTSK